MSKQTEVEDRTLRCSGCGTPFVWSVAEQVFYKTKNYDQPKRCRECRQAKKALLAEVEKSGITPRFSDINFKYTDARNEKIYAPEVLKNAFVDIQSCLTKILEPDKFLVYGSKGSGKTALASYYELMAGVEETLFSRVDDLEDFDYTLLSEGVTGGVDAAPRTVGAWKFLLSLRLFTLLLEDEGLCQQNSRLVELKLELDRRGLLPSPSLSKLASSALGKGAEFGLNFGIDLKAKLGKDHSYATKGPSQIAESLFSLIKELRMTDGKYLLFLDGLDHVLRGGNETLGAVGDLINAVRIINELLLTTALDAKIILLLRSEIARAIPNPDLTKRLSDNGLAMDWYFNVSEPFESDLLRVVQRRAALAGYGGTIETLWTSWLPRQIHQSPSEKYVTNRTRFLPRDLNRFFFHLQQIGWPPFTADMVLAAERNYSLWFFDELYDSLAGLLDERVRTNLSSILTQLGSYFTVKKLHGALEQRGLASIITGEELALLMFETHWIGNIRVSADHKQFNIFKSRNPSSGFVSDLGCVLSRGLIRGLGVNYRSDQQKT